MSGLTRQGAPAMCSVSEACSLFRTCEQRGLPSSTRPWSQRDTYTQEGIPALVYAAWAGHTSTVEALLNEGADANTRSRDGMTALDAAVRKGRTCICRLLLQAGADVGSKVWARTRQNPKEHGKTHKNPAKPGNWADSGGY